MVSRNRSTCGVKPYIRATCNPDADSWVADFLAWWIDPESGLPIAERAGVLRHYIRVAETIMWADRPEELMQDLPRPDDLPPGIDPPRPISVTFIPARVFDNPASTRMLNSLVHRIGSNATTVAASSGPVRVQPGRAVSS